MTSKTGTRSTRSKACNQLKPQNVYTGHNSWWRWSQMVMSPRFEEPWFSTRRWEWNAQPGLPSCDRFHLLSCFVCHFLSIGQAAARTLPGQLCYICSSFKRILFLQFGSSMFFIPDHSCLHLFDVRTVKYFPTSLFLALIWFAPQWQPKQYGKSKGWRKMS